MDLPLNYTSKNSKNGKFHRIYCDKTLQKGKETWSYRQNQGAVPGPLDSLLTREEPGAEGSRPASDEPRSPAVPLTGPPGGAKAPCVGSRQSVRVRRGAHPGQLLPSPRQRTAQPSCPVHSHLQPAGGARVATPPSSSNRPLP